MITLDTHALVWWVADDAALSKPARNAIEAEREQGEDLLISAISLWEIAMLVDKGRLTLSMPLNEWITTVERVAGLRVVPLDGRQAVAAVQLPGDFHPDPADRFITSLARQFDIPLLTADRRIRSYPHVETLW